MSVYISVVSHGHGDLIEQLSCLKKLAEKFIVVVKINLEEKNLPTYLEQNNIHYVDGNYGLGFGHNNNIVFSYCWENLDMKEDDFFIVFNPDVLSSTESIEELIESMRKEKSGIAAVNLFRDSDYSIPDNSIRIFPSLTQFIKSFLGLGNTAIIDKSKIKQKVNIDWAAGSFLAFTASHYARLKGFDEGYFMYCEDIDICYRSKVLGVPVIFYPQIKMLHLAEHANRSIFSKHFYWHVNSVIRFLLSKKGFARASSSL
ncbi:glycosyltransferase family 2 protein [Vibrio sp. 10N.261.51.A4]|uniref:glycosyltransferase family 2 protein n=1 Tax=Vibrio sp. 10N.261.51.A4 TaxID=3229674 RepID=UPI00354EE9F3